MKRGSGHHHVETRHVCVETRHVCKEAKRRLENREIETDELISLRMGTKKRLWGIREGSVFHILWWDPEHQVWPTEMQHT